MTYKILAIRLFPDRAIYSGKSFKTLRGAVSHFLKTKSWMRYSYGMFLVIDDRFVMRAYQSIYDLEKHLNEKKKMKRKVNHVL